MIKVFHLLNILGNYKWESSMHVFNQEERRGPLEEWLDSYSCTSIIYDEFLPDRRPYDHRTLQVLQWLPIQLSTIIWRIV